MKRLHILLICFCCTSLVQSQEATTFLPNWNIGDQMLVKETGKANMNMLGIDIPLEVNTSYQLRVTEKDKQGYTLEVTGLGISNISGGKLAGPILEVIMDAIKPVEEELRALKVQVHVTSQGTVDDMPNWKEVQRLMMQINEKMITSMQEKYKIPEAKADSILQQQNTDIDTKEEIMPMLSSLVILFSGYNVPFGVKETVKAPSNMYSRIEYFALNKQGTKAMLEGKLTKSGNSSTAARVDIMYDQQSVKEYIKKQDDSPISMEEAIADLSIEESRTFTFDTKSTWPTRITCNASLAMGELLTISIETQYTIAPVK